MIENDEKRKVIITEEDEDLWTLYNGRQLLETLDFFLGNLL